MTERSDPLTDAAIAHFLQSRSADPNPILLDDIVRAVEATPQRRAVYGLPSIALPRRTLLVLATALLLATMGAIGVGSRLVQPDPLVLTFGGTWISTSDVDGGTQTMSVAVSDGGAVEITVHDTIASVCSGARSTMTGSGAIEGGTSIVIAAPAYTCDDGSQPQALSGPPLAEQLRDWTMTFDPQAGTLTDSVGGVWHREGAAVPSPDSSSAPTVSDQMWPQTSLEEVREAQELADAGDPEYTWQVARALVGDAEPWGAEILERFLRQELGWEEFSEYGGFAYGDGGGFYAELVLIRCAAGRTNPVYPDDSQGRECAPTIDDLRYETVMLTIEQPVRRDASGIWVVTEWELLKPGEPSSLFDHLSPDFTGRQVEQVAPLSDAEAEAFLEAFLEARVEGQGAEQHVLSEPQGSPFEDKEVPLLYATTDGTGYERYQIDRVRGPEWPSGWMEYRVQLFAEETVVEQSFAVIRQDGGRLGLVYGYSFTDQLSTTENGQSVAVPYSLLDGEVTFEAAPPWEGTTLDRTYALLGRIEGGSASQFTMLSAVSDPLMGEGCEPGPAATDADALVRSIRSNSDLEATDPVPVRIGGIDAWQMDVVAPGQLQDGDCAPVVLERVFLTADERMRLYVFDLPVGMSATVLAIAISAHESLFDDVLEAATPVLDSLEIHAP
jgi:hypothetical protein